MSCEYFIRPAPPCPTCGRGFEPIKIGVSAIGWAFSFAELPEKNLRSKEDWLAYLADKVIEDEYGKIFTPAWFAAFVERKEGLRRA